MTISSPILVIAGSVRPRRISPAIAAWVAALGSNATGHAFEVVDLADWPLRMDDEPGMPQRGEYASPLTRAWSAKIAAAPAFVLVAPQYNWGYPAALKNALDHLYKEWSGKPVMIVTYGGHGGERCGDQLDVVCRGLHMAPIVRGPGLKLSREQIQANSGEIDPVTALEAQSDSLQAAFDNFASALTAKSG
jgi:NAD(P)H-dependent FMN reductase